MQRLLHLALCGSLLAFIAGCASPDFAASWKKTSTTPPPESIEGAWEGSWTSLGSGHTGRLRCLVTRAPETSPQAYNFHYWASWAKVLSGEFQVTYEVEQDGDLYRFSGEQDLGKMLGGVFTHTGEATRDRFEASYEARVDHGTFVLSRPQATSD
ncbi:MAG: hypothetical protein ACC661_02490 [Verrucomicrobiales bacterium]